MVGCIEIVKAGADERSCDSVGCENESFVVLKGGQRCGVCGNQLNVCRKCFADLAYQSRGILRFQADSEIAVGDTDYPNRIRSTKTDVMDMAAKWLLGLND